MSTNCSAICAPWLESTCRAISASTRRYHAKSSTSAYLSLEAMRRIVPRNSSEEEFWLNSMSFFTVSAKEDGVTMRSKSSKAILRAVVSDSSILCKTLVCKSGVIALSFACDKSRTSLKSSSARYRRFLSEELRKLRSFSSARAMSSLPSGIARTVHRMASNSTLCALVVFRMFVSGSTILAGRRASRGQSNWKTFSSLIDNQLLLVFTRMW
mmetsp:Transcript_17691/g.41096  ORF Transcript_17691/g.41096 Transcript_17691/m.41096 type:complete len:212 (-) Transcript_17691:712-1347(-)